MWWHRNRERDLDEEVQSWFEIQTARNEARGMTREEARREARRGFYGPEQVKQQVREERMSAGIESIVRDVRYALRALRRSPGFTVVAVLTVALGIGANTAIFSLINAVMLRILPVAQPEQLMFLTDPGASFVAVDTTENGVRNMLAWAEFERLRDGTHDVFSGMFAAESAPRTGDVLFGDRNHRARVQMVSGEFFGVLGVHAAAGRLFEADDERAGVISWAFWQREFAGKPNVIGQTVRVGNGTVPIAGIAPRGFGGIEVGSVCDIWVPLKMQKEVFPGHDLLTPKDTLWLQVVGRLKPGVSRETAEAGVNVTLQQLLADRGAQARERRQRIILQTGARGASSLRDQFSEPLLVLMAMVAMVLLIACANLANLMLARASARSREIGVRLALGAARLRLVREMMTESILIAAGGGALGIALAWAGTRALMAFASSSISDLTLDVRNDLRVLLFTATVAILTGVLFGLAPALRETRADLRQIISINRRGAGGARLRGGRTLVVVQIALSLILVTGAALLARSLGNMLAEKVGFDRSHLLQAGVEPATAGYKDAARNGLYRSVLEELRRIPGVRSATVANQNLFRGGDSGDSISLDGSPVRDKERLDSQWTLVGPDYFSTLGIPLLRGREMNSSDAERGAQVCVVNEEFARQFYPGLDPVGHHVTDEYPTTRETYEIIGVAANAKEHRPNEQLHARFYASLNHPIGTVQGAVFVIRTEGDPAAAALSVRAAFASVAPNMPVLSLRTADEQLERTLVTRRLIADLSGLFGSLGLFMAAIGIYGVMSYSMSRRTGEIGIRMALGASRMEITGMVLKETSWLVLTGVAIGVPCTLGTNRLIGTMLFGLKPGDLAALAVAVVAIVAVAALAAYLPARRAAHVDPMNALRCD